MAHVHPFGIHLALDAFGTGLFMALMAVLGALSVALLRRNRRFAVPAALLTAALCVAVLHRGLVAPAQTWPAILAAYQSSTGVARLQRAADLRANWHYGGIRLVDWWSMSRRWDVCHGMWPQPRCVRPPGPYEPEEVAREMLEEIATGERDPVISI